jgi:hypothetical protein
VRRILAATVAAAAWLGLIVQFALSWRQQGSAVEALWVISAYFTITTNVLVAVVFTGVAFDLKALSTPHTVGGTVLCIALVGVVYALLLRGAMELSGGSLLVDHLLHEVTPITAVLYWAIFGRTGKLRWSDPPLWAIYPLAYLAYAMWRGIATGKFAYPFLNVRELGWPTTVLHAAAIAIGFLAAAYLMVLIDRKSGAEAKRDRMERLC